MINDENSRSTDESSSSSMQLHYSSDDLMRNNEEVLPGSKSTDLRKKGRTNKLLKLLSSSGLTNLELPTLSKGTGTVDLTEKSDDSMGWLQTKFAINNTKKRKSGEHARKIITGSTEKKKLLTSIALKRKEAQAKRKEMYHGDNEDIMSTSEPEDEDYESDASDSSGDEPEESNSPEKQCTESTSPEKLPTESKSPVMQPTSPETISVKERLVVEASTSQGHVARIEGTAKDLFNHNAFPSSLSQWCENSLQNHDSVPVTPPFDDKFTTKDDDELLMLCSGKFESAPTKTDDADEDINVVCKKRGARVLVESDDEDEIDKPDPLENGVACNTDNSITTPEESADDVSTRKRVLISDDEEEDEEPSASNDLEAYDENEDEASCDESVNEMVESDVSINEDSDDELAVIKRLENKEYKKKSRSSKFFDDEASLSGDDVGSDEDAELDVENDYEREEGDDDDVPDDKVIALENHRHLLKEEQDKSHREIAKLQERLLPDGDLSAVQTNRSFRVRLREDVELAEEDDVDKNEDEMNDGEEEDHKSRIAALKLRLELQDRMAKETVEKDEENSNDPFEFAANTALSASASLQLQTTFVPSLLNRAPLVNAFKDMSNAVTAKQLYTRTENVNVSKRPQPALLENTAKKAKTSVLSSIDH